MCPTDRQRVERVPGSRRARLTAVEGTDVDQSIDASQRDDARRSVIASTGESGPNDERMMRDIPPHY